MSGPNAPAAKSAASSTKALRASAASRKLAKTLGLCFVEAADLTIQRRAHGKGFVFKDAKGETIRDKQVIARLNSLAVPPAYADALYCADPHGHIQAIWRDAKDRQQYRYHPDWEQVRAERRMRRLARLSKALPRIRRVVTQGLAADEPNRDMALATVVDLVASSGIRAGREAYAKNGTRGAATLLKSNVTIHGSDIELRFRAKGGKAMRKALHSPRLAAAMKTLGRLPGQRIFQYRDPRGAVRAVRASQVNKYLQERIGESITLKDFRTLAASSTALRTMARLEPAQSPAQRRRQVKAVMQTVADRLGNTAAMCRKSYVPAEIVRAFEEGKVQTLVKAGGRLPPGERLLAAFLAKPMPRRPRPAELKTQLKRSLRAVTRVKSKRAG